MTAAVPQVHEAVVDGIPAFWVDTPPPLTAILMFRVGAWDESLLCRGITHLVEHLALHALRKVEHPYNGHTGGNVTMVWATGTEAQLGAFFSVLCRELRGLPFDRLETEAKVLRAEAEQRPWSFHDQILEVLFGPNGPGLHHAPERGLDVLKASEIQAWADRFFVRENAVLLLDGRPPETLGIDLPRGEHRPYALPDESLGYRPDRLELVGYQDHGVCVGTLCRRSTDMVMALEVLAPRLTDRLRHELGLVYAVQPSYLPLDEDLAYVFVGTDAGKERLEQTAKAFLDVVTGLRDEPPTEEEVARVRRTGWNAEQQDASTLARGELQRVGWNRLLRYDSPSREELIAEREAATPASIREAYRAAVDRGLVWAPACEGLDLPERKKRRYAPVEGTRFKPRRSAPGSIERMLVGDEGVSCLTESRWVTIRWADLALAERTNPEEWSLVSRTGAWLTLQLPGWRRRRKLERLLEERIPDAVRYSTTRA